MAENIKEWFDEEIKWAQSESSKGIRKNKRPISYFQGYKEAMETAKYKLLRQGII